MDQNIEDEIEQLRLKKQELIKLMNLINEKLSGENTQEEKEKLEDEWYEIDRQRENVESSLYKLGEKQLLLRHHKKID